MDARLPDRGPPPLQCSAPCPLLSSHVEPDSDTDPDMPALEVFEYPVSPVRSVGTPSPQKGAWDDDEDDLGDSPPFERNGFSGNLGSCWGANALRGALQDLHADEDFGKARATGDSPESRDSPGPVDFDSLIADSG